MHLFTHSPDPLQGTHAHVPFPLHTLQFLLNLSVLSFLSLPFDPAYNAIEMSHRGVLSRTRLLLLCGREEMR